jgi:hypothetical protein
LHARPAFRGRAPFHVVRKLVGHWGLSDSRDVAKLPPQLILPFPKTEPQKPESKVVDLGAARRRLRPPPIEGRQAIVLTLVEQLAGLVRGTTTAERAGAVRRAASRALDVMDRVDAGKADLSDAQRACREIEALLSRRH